jgi:hypothetical protein
MSLNLPHARVTDTWPRRYQVQDQKINAIDGLSTGSDSIHCRSYGKANERKKKEDYL